MPSLSSGCPPCPSSALLSQPRVPSAPPLGLPPPSLTPPPSRSLCSGAGGGGCPRRGTWLVDALPGGGACSVPERRGARTAREQRTVGACTGCCLRLPTPVTWAPLLAAGGWAGDRGWGSRRPRFRAQRRPREPRAALARRVDAAPSEAAAARAAGALRGGLSLPARLGLSGALLPHQDASSTSASVCGGVFAHVVRVAIWTLTQPCLAPASEPRAGAQDRCDRRSDTEGYNSPRELLGGFLWQL